MRFIDEKAESAGTRNRPRATGADDSLRRNRDLPPGIFAGLFRRKVWSAESPTRRVPMAAPVTPGRRPALRPIAADATTASRRAQTWDGTLAAQKFLSCVYRIREKSRFGVGLQHVVEVLCGADTEKVRKFGHQSLSTYNIGGEHSRAEWGAIGRELVRLGLLFQNAEKFNIVELTDRGSRGAQIAAESHAHPARRANRTGETSHRRNRLRRGVVREVARLAQTTGRRARRAALHCFFRRVVAADGAVLSGGTNGSFHASAAWATGNCASSAHCSWARLRRICNRTPARFSPTIRSRNPSAPMPRRSRLTDTVRETLHFFRQGKTVSEIARIRGVKDGTIYSHLEEAMLAGETIDVKSLLPPRRNATSPPRLPNTASAVSAAWWHRSAANTITASAALSAPRCKSVGRALRVPPAK